MESRAAQSSILCSVSLRRSGFVSFLSPILWVVFSLSVPRSRQLYLMTSSSFFLIPVATWLVTLVSGLANHCVNPRSWRNTAVLLRLRGEVASAQLTLLSEGHTVFPCGPLPSHVWKMDCVTPTLVESCLQMWKFGTRLSVPSSVCGLPVWC